MSDQWYEPPGHRGHPTAHEQLRAKGMADRIDETIDALAREGFDRDEAISFIAGIAVEVSRERGVESWGPGVKGASGARLTLRRMLEEGRAAKHWTLDVFDITLATIHDMLEGGDTSAETQ